MVRHRHDPSCSFPPSGTNMSYCTHDHQKCSQQTTLRWDTSKTLYECMVWGNSAKWTGLSGQCNDLQG